MLKKNGVWFFIVFLALAAVFGCGKKEVVKPSDEAMKAARALDALHEMERAYKARDMAGLLAQVSPDFKGGLSEFQTRLRKDIETFNRADIEVYVERVEESGNEVRVAFHWYGRWRDGSGKEREGRGNGVFVFLDTGAMRLSSVVGDSPFGVVR